jgi:hypothetical protein
LRAVGDQELLHAEQPGVEGNVLNLCVELLPALGRVAEIE